MGIKYMFKRQQVKEVGFWIQPTQQWVLSYLNQQ